MIFLYAIALGVVLGYARGGRISNLPLLRLRALYLVAAALAIQVLIFPLFSPRPVLPYGTAVLHAISYAILLLWLALNARTIPLVVAGSGALLNALVVSVNGGYMPASSAALKQAGLASVAEIVARGESYGNIISMSDATCLNFLGDWIPLPGWLPLATAMSVGDALIMVGLAWLIAKGMRKSA